jgi:hypothetical protein
MNLQEQTYRMREMMGLVNEQETSSCQNQLNSDLQKAKKTWEDWLSNPATKQKFMTSHGYDENKTKEIFDKYFKALSELKVVPVQDVEKIQIDDYKKELIKFAKREGNDLLGFVMKEIPGYLFINCEKTSQPFLETIEHEISHVLDFIHLKTPSEKVSKLYNDQKIQRKLNKENLEDFFVKAGITDEKRKELITMRFTDGMTEKMRDKKYRCSEGENLVGIQRLRQTLKKNPGEDLTIDEIIPYFTFEIEDSHLDVDKLVACWVYKGLPDINNYLSELNTFAKNKSQQSSNAV